MAELDTMDEVHGAYEEPEEEPRRRPPSVGRQVLRGIGWAVTLLLGLVLVAVLGVWVFTNTDYGRERVRRIALDKLKGTVHGIVKIGGIKGDLLRGITLTDFSIADSLGRPFLAAAELTTHYSLENFLKKRIYLDRVRIVRPFVMLDRPPGGEWNYRRIFPKSAKTTTDTTSGFGDWIALTNVEVVEGRIMVRTPWSTAKLDSLPQAARDSAIAFALSDESRNRIERVEGGFQKVMDFRALSGQFPRVRIADPDSADMEVRVATASVLAEPFRPPGAQIKDLRATFFLGKDSLWWNGANVEMPGSKLAGDGAYGLGQTASMRLSFHGAPVATNDLRWLYPRLPADGGGTLDFAMRMAGDTSDFAATNADIRIETATLAGDFGLLLLPDSTRFHDTNLRFANVDTRLVERLVPNLELPRRGTLGGRAALAGTMAALRLDADVAFDDTRSGTSRVAAVGEVGMGKAAGGFRAKDLRLRMYPVQVDLARIGVKDLPVGGTLSGRVTLTGSKERWLFGSADVTHMDRGATSHLIGGAELAMAGRKWMRVDLRAAPVSLVTVGRFVPALGLQGSAAGTVRIQGPFDNLVLDTDLRLPDGGELVTRGAVDIASKEIGYDLTAAMKVFNLNAVMTKGPRTSLTALVAARGRGFKPETMNADLAANIARSSYDSLAFDTLHTRIHIADAMARIDSLGIKSQFATVDVDGTFGLAAGRSGQIVYHVQVDSLQGLARYIHSASDTGLVAPRPGRVAAALERARADSAMIAQSTEVERAATGLPMVKLPPVDTAPAIKRDSLAGSIYAAGTVVGGLKGFDVRGRAAFERVVALGNTVSRGRTEYALTNMMTPQSAIVAAADLDSVQAGGFAFDTVTARVTYQKPNGSFDVAVVQGKDREYRAKADFSLNLDRNEIRLAELALRFDTTLWAAPHPAAIRWGARGIELDHVELRHGRFGRVYANGLIPNEGAADVELAIEGFQVHDVVRLIESDMDVRGIVMLTGRLQGTKAAPEIRAALGVALPMFRGTRLPDIRATMQYANQEMKADAQLTRRGAPMAVATATLPVNLAFSGVTGSRLLDRDMDVTLRADSLPLDVLPKFTDAVSDIHGRIIGLMHATGRLKSPRLAGAFALDLGRMKIVASGVEFHNIRGGIRMAGDSIWVDSLNPIRAVAGGGRVRVVGRVGVAQLAKPGFDLRLTATNAQVLDNEIGSVTANADITMLGPLDSLYITGRARVLGGVIYMPEPDSKTAVSPGDPSVFAVADTALVSRGTGVPGGGGALGGLRMDVVASIAHQTFVRSSDGNIEIYTPEGTPLAVHMDRRTGTLALDGAINTDRGEYTVAGRRFEITRGSVTFIGAPELNPLLQLIGEREIQIPGREAINIRVVIGGTARNPRVTLESDAQPPISQSDLLSYLAFGRSSSSLLQTQGSGLSGQGSASGNLVGGVAALVARQMAGIALGAGLQELQANTARSLALDRFNITPSDIPTELSNSGFTSFLMGTQLEAGKYVNRNTFVATQFRFATFSANPQTRAVPGVRVERRLKGGLRVEGSFEPRYLLRAPSLSPTTNVVSPTGVFGAFLVFERRF